MERRRAAGSKRDLEDNEWPVRDIRYLRPQLRSSVAIERQAGAGRFRNADVRIADAGRHKKIVSVSSRRDAACRVSVSARKRTVHYRHSEEGVSPTKDLVGRNVTEKI